MKEMHNKNVKKEHGHIISAKEEHGCNRSVNKGHTDSSKEKTNTSNPRKRV
jgi:hypothetical protein